MASLRQETVTKDDLARLHSEIISNGETTDKHTLEIVRIMGGMDEILRDYVSKHNQFLDYKQINQLHQLLSTLSQYTTNNNLIPRVTLNDTVNADIDGKEDKQTNHFTLLLRTKDTIMNCLFGEEIGSKLTLFIWSKITILGMFTATIIGLLLELIIPQESQYRWTVLLYLAIYELICILYCTLMIISMNKLAVSMMAKSFELWFKVYYAAVSNIAWIIYKYFLLKEDQSHWIVGFIANVINSIAMVSLIIMVSMSDGIYMKYTRNMLLLIEFIVGLYYGYWSIYMELFALSEDGEDPSILRVSHNIHISMISMLTTAYRIVSIFLLKQSVVTIIYAMKSRKDNKAIFVRITPNIEWDSTKLMASPNAHSKRAEPEQEVDVVEIEEMKVETAEIEQSENDSSSSSSFDDQ